MFVLYALLGVAGGFLYARIRPARDTRRRAAKPRRSALGPSRRIVYKLAALFSIDAFAGGFAVQSLLALWLFEQVRPVAGDRRACSSSGRACLRRSRSRWPHGCRGASASSTRWSSRTSRRASCLILAAVAPSVEVALALLLVRAALSQMDVPTRSSYVMAVVTPPERAAAASFTSVPRSLAAAASPAIAGALFAAGFQAWPLVICGALKIAYDLALLWAFRHVKPPEES